MYLPEEILDKYQQERFVTNQAKNILCYGPYTALDFDHTGDMTVCCHNRKIVLGKYPENTIQEAWNSTKMKTLREKLANKDFSYGCEICYRSINAGNYSATGMYCLDGFSRYVHPKDMPTVFVFEFSNLCNLECIMCGGKWSSSIRTNREKLPNYQSPYNELFIEEIKKYLPDIRYTNFVGGEPFLEPLYYKIWTAIAKINPKISVRITTNGTIINDKIKNLFSSLPNAKLLISLDSLDKEIYENIRKNASFPVVYSNILYWLSINKVETILVCPMLPNWQEIPKILAFCEYHNVDIFFNTVTGALGGSLIGIHENGEMPLVEIGTATHLTVNRPSSLIPEFSLKKAPKRLLFEIIAHYKTFNFKPRYQHKLYELINLLDSWTKEPQS